jgi:hypothetical protein
MIATLAQRTNGVWQADAPLLGRQLVAICVGGIVERR